MLRRFLLVGLMVVVHNGEMIQLIIGTLVAAILLFFQVQAAPYNDMSDDYLAAASSFALLILLLCCIGFKYSALIELPGIWARMSGEQQDVYGINTGVLTIIVMLSIVGSLVCAGVLFVIQFLAEGARLRKEALASTARRLRYKLDDLEVSVPALGAGWVHIFLSHVWGSAQGVQRVRSHFMARTRRLSALVASDANADQVRVIKQKLSEMVPKLRVFLDVDGSCRRFNAHTMISSPFIGHAMSPSHSLPQISRTLATWRAILNAP